MTTPRPRVVLVGVDGSDESLAAVDLGSDEAVLDNCRLRLVTVIRWTVDGTAVRDARSEVDAAARRAARRHPGLLITTAVLMGVPGTVLVEESARADLLVVGHRGRGGFAAVVSGAVHAQVAASARCPVLVARPEEPGAGTEPEGPVVVGVDAGAHAARALAFGFEEASRRGVPLAAVHVWTEPPHPSNGDPTRAAAETAAAEQAAAATLAAALAGMREAYPGVPVGTELIRSPDVEEALVQRSAGASLIVVGSRGVGGLTGALLGSVGHALIHHAAGPVAIVRPDGADREGD
jgi:nucleotide-binding universal stress UspA family protein